MGNKHAGKLRQTDLDYFRHMTTFSDQEIRMYKTESIDFIYCTLIRNMVQMFSSGLS